MRSCLLDHLRVAHGETLVVRGGTSSVAPAAINVASELGAVVVATTRSRAKEPMLRAAGASDVQSLPARGATGGAPPHGVDWGEREDRGRGRVTASLCRLGSAFHGINLSVGRERDPRPTRPPCGMS